MSLCECGCGLDAGRYATTDRSKERRGREKRFIHGHNGRGQPKVGLPGEANPAWRGDAVGYSGVHQWIRKVKPLVGVCTECDAEGYTEHANVSGEYRRDVSDFVELCKSCHTRFDMELGRHVVFGRAA